MNATSRQPGRVPEAAQAIVDEAIRRMVKRLNAVIADLNAKGFDVANVEISIAAPSKIRGIRDSILALVEESDFLTSGEIADQLQDRIVTKSQDPRRVIMSTVSALHREGLLQKDALGRMSVARNRREIATA